VPFGWKNGDGVRFSLKHGKSTVTFSGSHGPAGEAVLFMTATWHVPIDM
jgi:hypothetical protein